MLRSLAAVALICCLVGCGSESIAPSVAEFEDESLSVEPVALTSATSEQIIAESVDAEPILAAEFTSAEAKTPATPSLPVVQPKPEEEPRRLATTPDIDVRGFYNVDVSTVMLRMNDKMIYGNVGDEFNGYRIESIDPPHVTVSQKKQQWTLALGQSVSRSRKSDTSATESSKSNSLKHDFPENDPALPFELPPLPELPSELLK